jgi:hypothetical protein
MSMMGFDDSGIIPERHTEGNDLKASDSDTNKKVTSESPQSPPTSEIDSGLLTDDYLALQQIYLDWYDRRRPLSGFINELATLITDRENSARIDENKRWIELNRKSNGNAVLINILIEEFEERIAALTAKKEHQDG